MKLKHSEITEKIIKAFYEVYNELGFGFLESVYESSLSIVLNNFGQKPGFKRFVFGNSRKMNRVEPCESAVIKL